MPKLMPVVRELPADLETPVSVYLKLAGRGPSFLLESITGGEQLARYSFIGVRPTRGLVFRADTVTEHAPDARAAVRAIAPGRCLLDELRDVIAACEVAPADTLLPRFAGGLVGYLSYDTVRFFEPGLPVVPHATLPDGIFLQCDTLVAFDHAFGRLLLMANAHDGDLAGAAARLDALQAAVEGPLPRRIRCADPADCPSSGLESNMTFAEFTAAVEAGREYIAAGDIFQVVLSQRFSRRTTAQPFDIYRALRRLNPSPYMFFFDFADLAGPEPLHLIGASPELHVRLDAAAADGTRKAAIRPIAGTRPRGADPAADAALERELLADPKECAEHVMLVDLARNDLGRVCEYGTVHAPELMTVERYSHVMHIVSHVEGRLRAGLDGFDLMAATFPAGTVSGAPKIRAMEIIHELERDPRGPYAGAVGYFSYDGSLDTCIAIRTLVMQGQTVSVQAGAGIVADSVPEREYQESVNKARALAAAVELAEAQ